MDEYAIMSPRVWTEIIRPAVSDKLGWVLFIGTPMGHNQFWEIYDFAQRGHKDWYAKLYRASETKVLTCSPRCFVINPFQQDFNELGRICEFRMIFNRISMNWTGFVNSD